MKKCPNCRERFKPETFQDGPVLFTWFGMRKLCSSCAKRIEDMITKGLIYKDDNGMLQLTEAGNRELDA